MAIITKSTVAKGQANEFDLSKSDLAAVSKVVNDSYFSDQANWSKVILQYESVEGEQQEVVVFDASEASPKGSFEVSEKARDSWEIKSILIMDFDGGYLKINRGELTVEEFDISLATLSVLQDVVLVDFYTPDTNVYNVQGNTVTKTSGPLTVYTSSVISQQSIENDGYFEITENSSNTSDFWFIGLNQGDRTHSGLSDFDFAINRADFSYGVWEDGVNVFSLSETPQVGDILKIAIESGVVKYYKNDVLIYTSLKVPSGSYYLQISLYDPGSSVSNLKVNNPI